MSAVGQGLTRLLVEGMKDKGHVVGPDVDEKLSEHAQQLCREFDRVAPLPDRERSEKPLASQVGL